MEPEILIYAFLSVCLAFVVKGLVGFGDPLISVPMLSNWFPTSVVIPALAPVSTALNAVVIWKNRKYFSPRIVLPISAFVMLGVIPGSMMLKYASSQKLKIALGILIIALGVEMLTRRHIEGAKPNPIWRSVLSFASGITAGLFGINLIFIAYMERVAPEREEFRVNTCFVFFLESIFRITMYCVQGIFSKESLILTAMAIPTALLGMKIGALIDKKVNDRLSRKIMIWVFIAGGVNTAVRALMAYLA